KTKAANANIYAIVGSDEAEVKRVAAELASNLTPSGAGDFGLETIDGAADNAEQAAARVSSTIDALQTLPFFGSTKVVWLKNVNFLGDNPKARSTAVQSALEELSELLGRGFGSEITFLISATEVDKRRGFYKALVKRAELQVFDRIDSGRAGWEEEATEIVRRRAKKRKLQFDDDALDLFVLLTGGDTRQIENELEKIDIFLEKDRAVHVDLVRKIVPLSRAGIIFELSNALAMRDLALALTLVRRLLDQGESAIGILLAAIVPTIRNLLLAKDLMERHRPPRPDCRGTEAAPTFSCPLRAFHLLTRHRTDVRNFPANACKRFYDCHDEQNKECKADQCPNDPQDNGEEQANCRNGG